MTSPPITPQQSFASNDASLPKLRLLKTTELPPGWVGKNYAVWIGARQAKGEWLLFTDADAVHGRIPPRKALATRRARKRRDGFVFSRASDGDVVRKGADSLCVLPIGKQIFL